MRNQGNKKFQRWCRKPRRPKAPWTRAFPKQARKLRPAAKRGDDQVLYRLEAREFLNDLRAKKFTCPVMAAFDTLPPEMQRFLTVPWTGNRRSNKITEVHHRYGRVRMLLRWQPGWIGLSKFGHRAVHKFVEESRRRGWLADHGWWNNEDIMVTVNQIPRVAYPKR